LLDGSARTTAATLGLEASVPRRLRAVIVKALQRAPERRFQTAQALQEALVGITDRSREKAAVRWTLSATAIIVTIGVAGSWPLTLRFGGPRQVRAVLALLPPAIPPADPIAEQLGITIASQIARNFRRMPGLTIVSRETTTRYSNDRTALDREWRQANVAYVLE